MGLITMFITRQPTQSREFRGSRRSRSDSPYRLICQPCEPSGQGLVMWFRWVSHAGVSPPSPLSDPATVPHYTPCHRQPHRQQAWQVLTLGHPFFFFFFSSLSGEMTEQSGGVGKESVYRIRYNTVGIPLLTCFRPLKSNMTLINICDLLCCKMTSLERFITWLHNGRILSLNVITVIRGLLVVISDNGDWFIIKFDLQVWK